MTELSIQHNLVGLQMMFELLRGGLTACRDFNFMAKSSFAILILVYLPAILLIELGSFEWSHTAVAYYCAMYIPHFALMLVFGWRMWGHLKAMQSGGTGPWVDANKPEAEGI